MRNRQGWCVVPLSLAALLALTGCEPSPEQKAEAQARQKEHCLNNFCEGDVEPQHDWATKQVFKQGGKWFVGPKEYGFFDGNGFFYWPSKTPGKALALDFPEKALATSGGFNKVAVEFWIEALPQDMAQEKETLDILKKAEAENKLVRREKIRLELEVVEVKEVSAPNGIGIYYVVLLQKTPSQQPPVIYCNESHPDYGCGTRFSWRQGFRIYVRFNQKYGRDWPEIYSEIIRILNLVEEKK